MADVDDRPATGEAEEEEEDEEVVEELEKRSNILYCGVCSIPPEYCEFNPPDLYADCLRWQSEHHPELLPEDKPLEEILAGLKLEEGSSRGGGGTKRIDEEGQGGEGGEEGEEDDVEGVSEGKKKKRGGGPKALKKKISAGGGKVVITRMSRNKRKCVTVVTGLDTYPELKLKDAAKAMGKLFACGASVSDTASGGKEIVIQGDVLDPLAAMLEDKYNVPAENIVLKT